MSNPKNSEKDVKQMAPASQTIPNSASGETGDAKTAPGSLYYEFMSGAAEMAEFCDLTLIRSTSLSVSSQMISSVDFSSRLILHPFLPLLSLSQMSNPKDSEKEEQVPRESQIKLPLPSFLRKAKSAATLANGGVYVTVSSLGAKPMLGLFAGRDYKSGEFITFYGGRTMSAMSARRYPHSMRTHMARISNSDLVSDGLPFSDQFDTGRAVYRVDEKDSALPKLVKAGDEKRLKQLEAQRALPAAARLRFLPVRCEDPTVAAQILECGVGYMGNSLAKGNNAKLGPIHADKLGNCVEALFATKPISAHDEITYAYRNSETFL